MHDSFERVYFVYSRDQLAMGPLPHPRTWPRRAKSASLDWEIYSQGLIRGILMGEKSLVLRVTMTKPCDFAVAAM